MAEVNQTTSDVNKKVVFLSAATKLELQKKAREKGITVVELLDGILTRALSEPRE